MIGIGVLLAIVGYVHCQNVQEVAFSVGLAHSVSYPSGNNRPTVIFDTQFTNIGGGYDLKTGVFTCPKAGIYLFQFHSLSHDTGSTWLNLYKENEYIQSVYGHDVTTYASAGNSCILKLNQGQIVTLKAETTDSNYNIHLFGASDEIYNTFSGYLLAPVDQDIAPVGK